MNSSNIFRGVIGVLFFALNSCQSAQNKTALPDSPKIGSKPRHAQINNQDFLFEKNNYLKIDAIYTGKTFTDNGQDVFYRVLEIPEEENIMLIAEKITIGEEGGSYRLIKRIRLTDNGAVLPEFGLSNVDSLKFIDSVRIEGLFNNKKKIVDLRL